MDYDDLLNPVDEARQNRVRCEDDGVSCWHGWQHDDVDSFVPCQSVSAPLARYHRIDRHWTEADMRRSEMLTSGSIDERLSASNSPSSIHWPLPMSLSRPLLKTISSLYSHTLPQPNKPTAHSDTYKVVVSSAQSLNQHRARHGTALLHKAGGGTGQGRKDSCFNLTHLLTS